MELEYLLLGNFAHKSARMEPHSLDVQIFNSQIAVRYSHLWYWPLMTIARSQECILRKSGFLVCV